MVNTKNKHQVSNIFSKIVYQKIFLSFHAIQIFVIHPCKKWHWFIITVLFSDIVSWYDICLVHYITISTAVF